MTNPRRGSRVGLTVGLLLAALLSVGSASASAAETPAPDSDTDGGALTVTIPGDPTPSPSPSATPSPVPSPAPSKGGGNNGGTKPITKGDVTQATIPDPAAADDALGDDAVMLDGILAMSGLTATASPSIGVGNGSVTLDFVVRNLSQSTFDAKARFWIDNAVGAVIADIDKVKIKKLAPDETRRIQVRIEDLGQNVVLHAHATLTPPKKIDGVETSALTRDTSFTVVPLFSVSVLGGLGVLGGVAWWVFGSRAFGMRLLPLG